jgi:hypothetical protein
MRSPTGYGEIVKKYMGRGEITFPLGGRIQSHFELTEFSTGKRVLTCEGRFTQASYPGWERLVHQYRLDGRLPLATAQKRGLVEEFAGRTEDNQHLHITQMVLIAAQATGVALLNKNLTLQMQFDCQDASLSP